MSNASDLAREVLQRFILRGGPIVATMYEGYRNAVMPPAAPPVQVLECKRAFFAGARTLLDLMATASDPGLEVSERDAEIMAAIDAELTAYIGQGQFREHAMVDEPAGRA